jgi:Methyltransferase domain
MQYSPKEAYLRYTRLTDPTHVSVAEDIKAGIRMGSGLTDIHDHLPRLLALAYGNILEIGVRFGVSTAALLYGIEFKGGHLWSVDTEDCSHLYSDPNWTFIREDSKNAAAIKPQLPDELQLLFIDGDHSYEGVKADLQNYGHLARVVALHDATRWGHEGVLPAIHEYFDDKNCRQKTMTVYSDSHGLAVMG